MFCSRNPKKITKPIIMEKTNRILPRLLNELKLSKTIGCAASVQNNELFELIELLEKENYWRNQYDGQIISRNHFELRCDDLYRENQALKITKI